MGPQLEGGPSNAHNVGACTYRNPVQVEAGRSLVGRGWPVACRLVRIFHLSIVPHMGVTGRSSQPPAMAAPMHLWPFPTDILVPTDAGPLDSVWIPVPRQIDRSGWQVPAAGARSVANTHEQQRPRDIRRDRSIRRCVRIRRCRRQFGQHRAVPACWAVVRLAPISGC